MGDRIDTHDRSHSSRPRDRSFVQDYKQRRLDDTADTESDSLESVSKRERRGKRRKYLRDMFAAVASSTRRESSENSEGARFGRRESRNCCSNLQFRIHVVVKRTG